MSVFLSLIENSNNDNNLLIAAQMAWLCFYVKCIFRVSVYLFLFVLSLRLVSRSSSVPLMVKLPFSFLRASGE